MHARIGRILANRESGPLRQDYHISNLSAGYDWNRSESDNSNRSESDYTPQVSSPGAAAFLTAARRRQKILHNT